MNNPFLLSIHRIDYRHKIDIDYKFLWEIMDDIGFIFIINHQCILVTPGLSGHSLSSWGQRWTLCIHGWNKCYTGYAPTLHSKIYEWYPKIYAKSLHFLWVCTFLCFVKVDFISFRVILLTLEQSMISSVPVHESPNTYKTTSKRQEETMCIDMRYNADTMYIVSIMYIQRNWFEMQLIPEQLKHVVKMPTLIQEVFLSYQLYWPQIWCGNLQDLAWLISDFYFILSDDATWTILIVPIKLKQN